MYFGAIDAHEAAVALGELRQKATKARDSATGARAQALETFVKKSRHSRVRGRRQAAAAAVAAARSARAATRARYSVGRPGLARRADELAAGCRRGAN